MFARIANKAAEEGVNLSQHALALLGVILQGEVEMEFGVGHRPRPTQPIDRRKVTLPSLHYLALATTLETAHEAVESLG